MGDKDIEAQLNYLCRDKYYHAMQTVALEAIKKHPNDHVFHFYKAFALLLGSCVPEAMRALDALQSDEIVHLGAIIALIHAHKKSVVIDREAVKELEMKLKERRKRASPLALYYAALFLYHSEKYEKAREYIDRALKNDETLIHALALKGWTELSFVKNADYLSNALHYFQSALDYDKNYLDGLFGIVCVDKMRCKYDTAIAVLNRLIVKHPHLVTPLIEKMKVQLTQRDWDQVLELIDRVLNLDKSNMEAIKLQILCMLCRDGKSNEASGLLEMLFSEMELYEPKNVTLFISIAQLFSRICGRNTTILAQTYKFVQKAVELLPNGVIPLTELGYQLMLQGNMTSAIENFQSATKLDESSVDALTYLTFCQLNENISMDMAQQQIELLYEIQGKKTPMLLLMSAMINRDNSEKALILLNEAVITHFELVEHLPYGDNYLKLLDPDFLILLVKEYFLYFPPPPSFSDEINTISLVPNEPIKKCTFILKKIKEDCPALLEGIYLLAKVQFYSGDTVSAIDALQHIINEIEPTLVDAHLLLARIFLQHKLYQRAAHVLEVGVSYNFRVREHPVYHVINGLIEKCRGNTEECIKNFRTAMENINSKENNFDISLTDKATLYLELADILFETSQNDEAEKVMESAIETFKGTPAESRVTIANADFCIKNDKLDLAFELLEKIKPNDPYYLQAHTKLANLYLHKRRDHNSFTRCFREVVENCPGPETFVLLGDAYMSLLELDLAIESYQQALKQNVHDPDLAKKMGKALVTTFRFDEAIVYYKEAIKNQKNCDLKFDLAELYINLDRLEDAEALLVGNFTDNRENDDLENLIIKVKQYLLLGKVHEQAGKYSLALSVLKEAKDIQHKIQRRIIMDQTGSATEQKTMLSDICVRLAEICKLMRDNDQAMQHYKEALNASPNNIDILTALAKLYLQANLREQCEKICTSILLIDSENEEASIIMADLAFRKIDFETAMHHFKQLLLKQPYNWKAFAKLIEIARRTGNLDEIPAYIKRVEEDSSNIYFKEAGFIYCTALYEWYSGNLNASLRNFNKVRLDPEWGQQAIYNMIEICLNPDDDFLGADAFSEINDNADSRRMAIEMAERLHHELKPRAGNIEDEAFKHRVIKNFILLATKQKQNIERALQDFTAIASQDTYRDHVGAILGMASACLLLKQTQRARNHLKRVAKNSWSYEDAEYLERSWLLLADNYTQSNKYEVASDLLKRVLQHNKSCVTAYEYLGYIAEKEQNYKEAAYHYDKAWKLSGHSKPAIGYKLAYTYLKSRQYANAIEISSQVLKEFPEYPKIKKDIFEKARNNLRT